VTNGTCRSDASASANQRSLGAVCCCETPQPVPNINSQQPQLQNTIHSSRLNDTIRLSYAYSTSTRDWLHPTHHASTQAKATRVSQRVRLVQRKLANHGCTICHGTNEDWRRADTYAPTESRKAQRIGHHRSTEASAHG
jgi:hypothetical protein